MQFTCEYNCCDYLGCDSPKSSMEEHTIHAVAAGTQLQEQDDETSQRYLRIAGLVRGNHVKCLQ